MIIRSFIGSQNSTAVNRGYDVGKQVANLAETNPGALSHAAIQYTTKENGSYSIDGGLAYSSESLKASDKNDDGVVDMKEAGPIGSKIDFNGNGELDASENLALTMFQDAAGKMDGVVTPEERIRANQFLMTGSMKALSQVYELYKGYDLDSREQALLGS